jgi:hypothetical protein
MPSPERHEQILDRASELATEAGLGQVTMKRIAARVGFSEAAIYRHFPTRPCSTACPAPFARTRLDPAVPFKRENVYGL